MFGHNFNGERDAYGCNFMICKMFRACKLVTTKKVGFGNFFFSSWKIRQIPASGFLWWHNGDFWGLRNCPWHYRKGEQGEMGSIKQWLFLKGWQWVLTSNFFLFLLSQMPQEPTIISSLHCVLQSIAFVLLLDYQLPWKRPTEEVLFYRSWNVSVTWEEPLFLLLYKM